MFFLTKKYLIASIFLFLIGCSKTDAQSYKNLEFSDAALQKIHTVKVQYVRNTKFPNFEDNDLREILSRATKLASEHLKLNINFDYSGAIDIDLVNAQLGTDQYSKIQPAIYDFKKNTGNKTELIRGTVRSLKVLKDDNLASRSFAAPYLIERPKDATVEAFSEALVDTQLSILNTWKNKKLNQNSFLIDDTPYNEYMYWWALITYVINHDLVITNQLIASAEYSNNSVHSAIRGGVSNGLTASSIKSVNGIASVVSVFPFTSADKKILQLRQDAFSNKDQQLEAIAAMVVHELGHQLLALGHPFGNSSCIMTPPESLRFKVWLSSLNANNCALNTSELMNIGNVKFLDLRKAH
jgi:hypothetical protein